MNNNELPYLTVSQGNINIPMNDDVKGNEHWEEGLLYGAINFNLFKRHEY